MLRLDPGHDKAEYYQWVANLYDNGSGENEGFEATGYYNDSKFIDKLNTLLDGNRLGRVKKVKKPIIEKHDNL